MHPKAEMMKLECLLCISEETSQLLLKLKKKTRRDIAKILWECERQMKLINDFTETDTFNWINGEQRYWLHQQYIHAENIYYELSQR